MYQKPVSWWLGVKAKHGTLQCTAWAALVLLVPMATSTVPAHAGKCWALQTLLLVTRKWLAFTYRSLLGNVVLHRPWAETWQTSQLGMAER